MPQGPQADAADGLGPAAGVAPLRGRRRRRYGGGPCSLVDLGGDAHRLLDRPCGPRSPGAPRRGAGVRPAICARPAAVNCNGSPWFHRLHHRARHLDEFVDAGAAGVAGVVALTAAAGLAVGVGIPPRRPVSRRSHSCSCASGWCGSLQWGHSTRTRRCAITSCKRQRHHVARHAHVQQPDRGGDSASLVCSVESTRCPVSAARMPISAVVRVAHLAHQHHVRVLAQSAAQHALEAEVDLVHHLHLVQAGQAVLHRILHRDDLLAGIVSAHSARA